ncbi:probable splicing factor, arginine/serine-rich 6 [Drosophila hydei]|uniref:Probable splicing factor, arginine/serine-rich 6 n=1 Tax=Drosophila hydei TaxID=7224 RepID=A0A6J2SXC4_DROHY|nr:probable splicing factor, arginine/serine-rich 6 [Drosophila hydei]
MSSDENRELISRLILQANQAQCLLVDVLKELEESQNLTELRSKTRRSLRRRKRSQCRCRDYSDSDSSDQEFAVGRKSSAVARDRKRDRSRSRGRSRGHSRGRSHGRSRSRSHTNTQHKQLALAVRVK